MLPKGEATKVKCQVHFGPVPEGMRMIFEPNGNSELPEGLELGEEFTKINPGNIQPRDHLGPQQYRQKHLAKAQNGTGPSTHG